jgi:hypothetical protein
LELTDSAIQRSAATRLFTLSFASLFLELMVIRWVPSEVRLVAYYANLMLISSFLGLGIGAMLSSRGWRLFRWFGVLLLIDVLLLLALSRTAAVPVETGEWKFDESQQRVFSFFTLVSIFVMNAMLFVPLGEQIGVQFARLPALRAYTWDLLGSLSGTVVFALFSLLHFSPILGMTLVILLTATLSERRALWWGVPCYIVALGTIWLTTPAGAYWSPYYFITVSETIAQNTPGSNVYTLGERPAAPPPPQLRQMIDPPVYSLRVNKDIYQLHGSIAPARYSEPWKRKLMDGYFRQYGLAHQILGPPGRVLVLGAGGGADVEAALIYGAASVDAVEIDPLIPRIGDRISSAAPYQDPRVSLHIEDARAFLQNSRQMYDRVVFGFLDSQGLFSYGSNLRIDGYTYTVESLRSAFARVNENGAMTVSFFAGQPWMAYKLSQMIEQAVGQPPIIYFSARKLVMIVPRRMPANVPDAVGEWQRVAFAKSNIDLATDDWPYLYLEARSIPRDYAIAIGALLAISVLTVMLMRRGRFGSSDAHFLMMGWGFLLLQTKSIGDCSLYFGTTWFVTSLLITGVLIMVLAANWVVEHFHLVFHAWLYAPLFAWLVMLLVVPRTAILAQPLAVRVAWTLLAVPLPVFFAGLIFSTTFRVSANRPAAFGANLIGATLGGFCEYLSMWMGIAALGYVVIGAYAASLCFVLISRRSDAPTMAAAAI